MAGKPNMFSVIEGECDGYRVVAMIGSGLKDHKAKRTTPWFLGLSTPLSKPTPDGLPTAKEANDLNLWEDVIDRELSSQCESVFVGRVTWKGNRELLYYVDKPEPVVQEIQKLIKSGTMRAFAVRYEWDAEWTNVSIYLK